jgi:hypothetical protein
VQEQRELGELGLGELGLGELGLGELGLDRLEQQHDVEQLECICRFYRTDRQKHQTSRTVFFCGQTWMQQQVHCMTYCSERLLKIQRLVNGEC